MRHGYMTMGVDYEKRGEQWFILWSCPKTWNVIKEMPLGETNATEPEASSTAHRDGPKSDEEQEGKSTEG